jgi:hypothetical protein
MRTDGANQGTVTGLPILRVPITKSFGRALGLVRTDTTLTSNPYAVGTPRNTTRRQASRIDPVAGDSVEELIVASNDVRMTRRFSVQVNKEEQQ